MRRRKSKPNYSGFLAFICIGLLIVLILVALTRKPSYEKLLSGRPSIKNQFELMDKIAKQAAASPPNGAVATAIATGLNLPPAAFEGNNFGSTINVPGNAFPEEYLVDVYADPGEGASYVATPRMTGQDGYFIVYYYVDSEPREPGATKPLLRIYRSRTFKHEPTSAEVHAWVLAVIRQIILASKSSPADTSSI